MNFSVCLFNLIFCMCLIVYYTWTFPVSDEVCSENKLYYYKYLRYLLYVYIVLLLFIVIGNRIICNNIFLLLFGFITVGFITIICININPKNIKCITKDLSSYFSLMPILIVGIMSLFLGYLGNILKINTVLGVNF